MLIVDQSLLHRNPPNIWIKTIQIGCLYGTKFLDPYCNLNDFGCCKWGNRLTLQGVTWLYCVDFANYRGGGIVSNTYIKIEVRDKIIKKPESVF